MLNMTDDLLARTRACCTTEERVVVALESIADQLRTLAALVAPVGASEEDRNCAAAVSRYLAGEEAWENEGGQLDLGAAATLGIKQSEIHQFEIGGYRYTKLADAIAEAQRTRARCLS